MPTITTQVEIGASPLEVRKAFLDFNSYQSWSKSHFTSLEVTKGDSTNPEPGDILKLSLGGMTFSPKVLVRLPETAPRSFVNTAEEFRWLGSVPYVFTGEHFFRFTPSTTTKGETTFVQGETFSGCLSFLVAPGWRFGEKTKKGFETFNGELKTRVEGSKTS